MTYARTEDGRNIFYREAGDPKSKDVVVMLQGLGMSHKFWFGIPDEVATDPQHPRRVIAIDNRGVGQSDAPKGAYTMARFADDVACVMSDAKVDEATLVGISMGGMIAQHVALRHPKKVKGLVLMATMPGLPHARLPAPKTIATLLKVGAGRDKSGVGVASLLLPKGELARAKEHFAGWQELMLEKPVSPAAFAGQLAAILRHSTGFKLKNVKVPTVVVTGDEDVLVPPKNSHVIAKKIPGAKLEVLEGVGHGIPMIDKTIVTRALSMIGA
ncbi:MAG TPA: alpha/beta hydrolase [Polyangiaceae bacterium]